MKIYTKTGDDGTTAIGYGGRLGKSHYKVCALGELDELNSNIGYLVSLLSQGHEAERLLLTRLQHVIFDMGTAISWPKKAGGDGLDRFIDCEIANMEVDIDSMTAAMPVLTAFIMPGGGQVQAYTHVVRTVCRRAERSVSALPDCQHRSSVLRMLNRLSDYLFTLARYMQWKTGLPEVVYVNWQKRD
jgi:cob(I)alamin adenosyltransferase